MWAIPPSGRSGEHCAFLRRATRDREAAPDVDLFSDRRPFEYEKNCKWEVWEKDQIRYDPTERGFGHFFVFASAYWRKHFGAVGEGPLRALDKIEKLCRPSSMRMDNSLNQHCRPDCTIKARFDFPSNLHDPLSITALCGTDGMLRHMLANADIPNDPYLPSSAMAAVGQVTLGRSLEA